MSDDASLQKQNEAFAKKPETIGALNVTRPQNGAEYLDSLRDDRVVYLYGERVKDVTTHPAFRNTARMIARMYDALHDPAKKDILTAPTDTGNGGYTHKFYLPSRTLTEANFAAFQTVSGDNHPIHYDIEYCRRQGHPGLLAHPGSRFVRDELGESVHAAAVGLGQILRGEGGRERTIGDDSYVEQYQPVEVFRR